MTDYLPESEKTVPLSLGCPKEIVDGPYWQEFPIYDDAGKTHWVWATEYWLNGANK